MGIRNANYTYQKNLMAALMLMLRPQGATIKDLRERLGVARSTVYEYIDVLSSLGYPVSEPERRGREMVYHADPDSIRKLIPLTGNTELSVDDREMLEFLEHISGNSALRMVLAPMLDKLMRLVPDGGISYGKSDGTSLSVLVDIPPLMKKSKPETAGILSALISAARQKQWIDIDYYSASSGEQKRMEKLFPVVCFMHNGGCYFYAICSDGKLLTLSVERISELKVIVGKNVPPEYSEDMISELLQDPFGITLTEIEPITAKLYIDAGQAYYYKEIDWPDSVRLEELEDGAVILTVRTRGTWEFERWIMKNSPAVKVLEPDSVIEDIKWTLNEALRLYENK